MRRGGAIAAVTALLAAGLLALPAADRVSPLPGSAEAADCVTVHHSKRVVKRKKVRRRGKLVKVKRRRTVRWTTCEPVAPPPPACDEPAANLGVIARDLTGFAFTLTRPCVSAGSVSVELDNRGDDAHALSFRPSGAGADPVFRIPGPSPAEVAPDSQASDDVELSAGDWYLWCDLPGHEAAGMSATLQVR